MDKIMHMLALMELSVGQQKLESRFTIGSGTRGQKFVQFYLFFVRTRHVHVCEISIAQQAGLKSLSTCAI